MASHSTEAPFNHRVFLPSDLHSRPCYPGPIPYHHLRPSMLVFNKENSVLVTGMLGSGDSGLLSALRCLRGSSHGRGRFGSACPELCWSDSLFSIPFRTPGQQAPLHPQLSLNSPSTSVLHSPVAEKGLDRDWTSHLNKGYGAKGSFLEREC